MTNPLLRTLGIGKRKEEEEEEEEKYDGREQGSWRESREGEGEMVLTSMGIIPLL